MRIDLPVPRRRPLSMTSLIDIIFLLFLFFMLSSTFLRFAEVEVTGGAASSAARGEAPDILIRLDSQSWQVNGVSTDPEQGMAELKRLQEVGAEKAVLLVRDGLSSQDLVGALEKIRRETTLFVTVAR